MNVDIVDLAAAYSVAIACRHCVQDGNIRSAVQAADVCLHLPGIPAPWQTEVVSEMIIRAAQAQLDEAEFAETLRAQSV